MRILTINLSIDSALTALGHEVLSVLLPAGVYALHSQPGVSAFQPDLLIQQEALGNAVILTDVDTFSCPKAFWSIDTHLNLFWHRYYGRLFDCFLTPHADFCTEAPPHWQHPYTCRLPFAGLPVPWRAHAERSADLNFVGRITLQRPMRQQAIQFLQQRYRMGLHQDISRADMLTLYTDTRILPNETIAFESNFRLLEGASCGCCLISPHVGADQDAVLEPGKEVLVYADALECAELIDLCLRKPRMAEAVGRMAWERVQASHLPEHRAVQLLQILAKVPAVACEGAKAREALWCSGAELELTGTFSSTAEQCPWAGTIHDTASTLALRLRAARHRQNMPQCSAVLQTALHILPPGPLSAASIESHAVLDCGPEPENARLCMAEAAVCMALHCLECGDLALARLFGDRLHYCLGEEPPPLPTPPPLPDDDPENAALTLANSTDQALGLALLWAEKLYTSHGHWYAALEVLTLVPKSCKKDGAWAELLLRLQPVVRHFPLLALSALARLSMNNEHDPNVQAAYIAMNIRCFRLQDAQEEWAAGMARWRGTPTEAAYHTALLAHCKNFPRLGAVLQPFSRS